MPENTRSIALTEFAHGAGCGCKIAPQVLSEILKTEKTQDEFKNLLVGNSSNDDAAVYDIGDGRAIISTADFFTPIVDDAFDFGRIAAANAISDVYAMGGTPTLALALLGWPVEKLPAALAAEVLDGARTICAEANIPLAGGHSIDTPEPIFGLSVTGLAPLKYIRKNNSSEEGDLIFITKPIGTGILSTAGKRKLLKDEDRKELIRHMATLNKIGEKLSKIEEVTAMTDVTGFGLLGHLIEMAKGSGLSAVLNYNAIPKMNNLSAYIAQSVLPDATFRNWNAYQSDLVMDPGVNAAEAFMVLPDPQTNGGILFSVNEKAFKKVVDLLQENQLGEFVKPIGRFVQRGDKIIKVEL